jgi:hypothetical protein
MKFLLIILITLSNTRKEAAKRWPAPAQWTLRVDQTKTAYIYELEVKVLENQFLLMGYRCEWTRKTFKGNSWQSVLDQSKNVKSSCTQ